MELKRTKVVMLPKKDKSGEVEYKSVDSYIPQAFPLGYGIEPYDIDATKTRHQSREEAIKQAVKIFNENN